MAKDDDNDHGGGHGKEIEIVIDGTPHEVPDENVSFEEVVKLAYPTPPTADTRFNVTYYGADKPKEGTLKAGQSVKVKKHGTVFNVNPTVKS